MDNTQPTLPCPNGVQVLPVKGHAPAVGSDSNPFGGTDVQRPDMGRAFPGQGKEVSCAQEHAGAWGDGGPLCEVDPDAVEDEQDDGDGPAEPELWNEGVEHLLELALGHARPAGSDGWL